VCTLFTHYALQLKAQSVSSQEIVLADGYISMLERYIPKFRAADTKCQKDMVEEAADRIKATWTEDTEFDRDTVISVCGFPATLCYS